MRHGAWCDFDFSKIGKHCKKKKTKHTNKLSRVDTGISHPREWGEKRHKQRVGKAVDSQIIFR